MPTDPQVEIALIVAIPALIGPAVMAIITHLIHKAEKREDYAREDAIAAKAATAAKSLLVSNERVAATAKIAANAVKVTNEKLDQIHTLVNSNMTAALRAELGATQRELAMMREVVDLKRAAGHEPSQDAISAIKATEDKIAELSTVLIDRLKAQDIIDKARDFDLSHS